MAPRDLRRACVLSLFAAVAIIAAPAPAVHAQVAATVALPEDQGGVYIGRLGIGGYADYAGFRVRNVQPFSVAEQIGLEVDDVIVSVNNRPTRNAWELNNALWGAAAYNGGFARLRIIDCRTGYHVFRNARVY